MIKSRSLRWAFGFCAALYLVLIVGDYVYSRYVDVRVAAFESQLSFDAEGVREGCEAYSAGEGTTALLFVHGFNDSPRVWDEWVEAGVERGFACRAMRLPGFAERHSEYGRYTAEQWSETVLAEIQALAAKHERVVLIGHSLGGALALRAAYSTSSVESTESNEKASLIDSLVLIAPAIDVSSARSPVLTTKQWHRIGSALLWFTDSTASPFAIDANDPRAAEYEYRTAFTPRIVIDQMMALFEANRRTPPRLSIPVFLALSAEDHVVDNEAARRWWQSLEAPNKTLINAEQSAHALPLDHDRERVMEAMFAFLERSP